MADEKKENVTVKEATTSTGLKVADLVSLLPPKTSAVLPGGSVVKVFASAKEIPLDNEKVSEENCTKPLKITRSKEDINSGYAYLKRLEVLRDMLAGAADLASLRTRVKERRELVGRVFEQNMATVFEKQRPLEKTYRELDTFFYEARLAPGENVAYVKIVNASADKNFDQLMDPENGLMSKLPTRENFDMKALIGLMIMPEWPGSEAKVLKYGEMAQNSMAHLFTGFPDVTLGEAHAMFEVGGDLSELKSTDLVKQCISVIANPLRIRKANRYEKSIGDLYISPTGIFGGKVYRGDTKEGIHVAQANKEHAIKIPTPDGSPLEMKWKIVGGKEMKFNKSIIPLAENQGIVFWGVDTLYLAGGLGDEGMDQYTVKRCDEYIAKVLLHFLNERIFIPNELEARDRIGTAIQKFLMHNTGSGNKMLEFGKVESVDVVRNPDGSVNNQAVDVKVAVKYKNAIRQINLDLHFTGSDAGWQGGKK